jgi:hypothetical protein
MKFLLVLLLLAAVLFATNPGEQQFKEFVKLELRDKVHPEGEVAEAVVQLLSGATSWIAGLATERQNFYLFSFYQVKASENYQVRYIGILNHFFLLT